MQRHPLSEEPAPYQDERQGKCSVQARTLAGSRAQDESRGALPQLLEDIRRAELPGDPVPGVVAHRSRCHVAQVRIRAQDERLVDHLPTMMLGRQEQRMPKANTSTG
jgi:hypothetical protein